MGCATSTQRRCTSHPNQTAKKKSSFHHISSPLLRRYEGEIHSLYEQACCLLTKDKIAYLFIICCVGHSVESGEMVGVFFVTMRNADDHLVWWWEHGEGRKGTCERGVRKVHAIRMDLLLHPRQASNTIHEKVLGDYQSFVLLEKILRGKHFLKKNIHFLKIINALLCVTQCRRTLRRLLLRFLALGKAYRRRSPPADDTAPAKGKDYEARAAVPAAGRRRSLRAEQMQPVR